MLNPGSEIYFWHFWYKSAGFNRGVPLYLEHYQKQKYAILLFSETCSSCRYKFSLHGEYFITSTPLNTTAVLNKSIDGADIWSYIDIFSACVILKTIFIVFYSDIYLGNCLYSVRRFYIFKPRQI